MSAPRPRFVAIGHLMFEIKYLTEKKWFKKGLSEDRSGQCGVSDARLLIRTEIDGMPQSEDNMREIVLHEIMHACYYVANMPGAGAVESDALEEWIVGTLTFPLILCMQRNPEVFDYIMDRAEPVD